MHLVGCEKRLAKGPHVSDEVLTERHGRRLAVIENEFGEVGVDNQLVIQGRRETDAKTDGKSETAYLHRGIAARAFLRTFVLADGMEVVGALLEHGLLHIDVARVPRPSW